MRKPILILAALAALASPPGAAAARPRHKPPAAAPAPKAATPAAPEADAADPAAPTPAFGGLAALSEAQARARLGPPDIARSEGSGAMWTYRLPDCALFVFFRSTGGQPLKVSGASAGPRRRGQTPLPVEACIAQARAGKP